MNSATDLLAQAAASDPQAFASLYDRFFPRVYTYLRYRCGDAAEADDLAAQVFERLLARLEQYQPQRGAFEPWLFTIAHNVLIDHARKQRRFWQFWQEQVRQTGPGISPEEHVIGKEDTQHLLAAIARLDERSRELVSLKFFAQLSNRQIAEMLQLSESNVGVILYRAVAQMRSVMKNADRMPDLQGVKSK